MVDENKSAQSAAQSAPASNPVAAGQQAPSESPVEDLDTPEAPADPGFLERGGLRRRLRFLRKTRELAYRDLGGLVFEMHRVGQQREDLQKGKLATLDRIDSELRAIEGALREHRGVTVLREAGVTACPRCAAIHGSEDRFCPACGFSMSGHAERPIAATPVATSAATPAATSAVTSAATQAAAPAQSASPSGQTASSTSQPASPAPRPASPAPATSSPSPAAAPASPAAPARPATPAQPAIPAQPASPPRPPPPPRAAARPPRDEDQPTEVVEPPTQIVRPSAGEQATDKSNRA